MCNSLGEERDRDTGELRDLVERYERGEIPPAGIELGELPEHASDDDRRVADDLRLLMELYRADGDERPVMYSCRFCAARMGWTEENAYVRASRILRRLDRWGVIECAGSFEKSGRAKGAKLYAPPRRNVIELSRHAERTA